MRVLPAVDLIRNRRAFRNRLRSWFRASGRDLPWRGTRDAYAILVSEIMLQQTQVVTVLPYYTRWLERFPDFRTLAQASESEVLHAWQGLGYYARARNLHAAAKAVVARGSFPDGVEEMRKLPGLGRYTANAIATFAFGKSVPVVEANTARLLARLTNQQLPIDSAAGRERLWDLAAALIPPHDASEFNSALMDLGATICVARQPKCLACPVRNFCRATDPANLPIKKPRAATKRLFERHAFIFEAGQILLEQSGDRWRGMWILPRLASAPTKPRIYEAQFPFTNHLITLAVHPDHVPQSRVHRWFDLDFIKSIPMPSPHRRALDYLLMHEPQKLCSTSATP
ncbi:MAG: A/G-specific adenine glycosylase [Verrucomicrobiota bacterium]|nr:A/G-specific adenine glycosylase [Verrucomicrobiota bacterium]